MPSTDYRGPVFQMVEQRAADSLVQQDAGGNDSPLLVKGAVRSWPAWTRWSFDQLAELRYADGKEAVCRFQEGLVELGVHVRRTGQYGDGIAQGHSQQLVLPGPRHQGGPSPPARSNPPHVRFKEIQPGLGTERNQYLETGPPGPGNAGICKNAWPL